MKRAGDMTDNQTAVVFESELGWIAAVWHGEALWRLSCGNRSQAAAARNADVPDHVTDCLTPEMEDLVARLLRYAIGEHDDFLDVLVDMSGRTRFQSAILERCRRIAYGQVMTYGQLAAQAGYPRSARAVGNVMSSNRVPLIVPCHRVVGAGGALGGYSAPEGLRMKRRLLQLEGGPSLSAASQGGRRKHGVVSI